MRASQRKAAIFLTGAVLVGGVTGAAGNVWYSDYARAHSEYRWPGDKWMEDIGLSCEQRNRTDSILHATDQQVRSANAALQARREALMAPARALAAPLADSMKARSDSIWAVGRVAMRAVMTPAQQARQDAIAADADKQNKEWGQHPDGPPKTDACGKPWFKGGDGRRGGPGGPDGRGGRGGPGGHGPSRPH